MRERLWALLMRALEDGRTAGGGARGVRAGAAGRSPTELGVDPGSELQRLYAELLAADASSAAASGSPTSTSAARRPTAVPRGPGPADAASSGRSRADAGRATSPPDAGGALGQTTAAVPDAAADAGVDAVGGGMPRRGPSSPGSIAIGTIRRLGFVRGRPGRGWRAPDAALPGRGPVIPRPTQLPADIGDFTGRETHVEQLCALLLARHAASSPGAVPHRGRERRRRASARPRSPCTPRTRSARSSLTASSTLTCSGRAPSRPARARCSPGSCAISASKGDKVPAQGRRAGGAVPDDG